jgi:phosphoheptose isomerase
MVVLNFNAEMADEEIEELENRFQKNRREFPALCLITSCDFQKYSV